MKSDCDTFYTPHLASVIGEDENAIKVYCKRCTNVFRVGKDWRGAPNNKQWGKLFFTDVVQPPHPLYYKLHPQVMHTV